MNSKRYVLVILGFFLAFSATAQWPSQNLFYRAQSLEFQQLKNKSIFNNKPGNTSTLNTLVEFPLRCVTKGPDSFPLWPEGENQFGALHWKDAAMVYESCIRIDSSFCDAYFRLGQCYAAQSNLAAAIRTFRLALQKFPSNPMVYLGLGQLYLMNR